MIYKNGELWEGWREELSTTHGVKFKLTKPVTFATISKYAGTKKIDQTLVPVYANVQIPCEYTWTDSKGARHQIKYAETSNVTMVGKGVNKEPITIYRPRRIAMKGHIKINVDQLELYWFLINHPFCGTSKRFSKENQPVGVGVRQAEQNLQLYGKDIVFNETNPERDLENAVELDKLIAKAKMVLYETVGEKELRSVYAFYDKSDSMTADANSIRLFLKKMIEGKPLNKEYSSGAREFLSILDDKARAIKSTVTQAQELDVIVFVKGQRTWLLDGHPITQVPKTKNEVKYLVEYLEQNDNGEVMKALEEGIVKKEKDLKESRKAEFA